MKKPAKLQSKENRELLSIELETCLNLAFQEARKRHHAFMTAEHVLWGLAQAPSLVPFWAAFGVKADKLQASLIEFMDSTIPPLDGEAEVQPTLGLQKTLQRAVFHVQSSGKHEVTPANVLIALFSEKGSHAWYSLVDAGITRLDAVYYFKGLRSGLVHAGSEKKTFQEELEDLETLDIKGRNVASSTPRLFISYSHADRQCLERLLIHLRPLERAKLIACWSDTNIRTGDKWRKEIQKNIDEAAIAILLVSADFLASEFIVNNELPPLLMGAEARGVRILPVILKPCGFVRDRVLSNFQCANDPKLPLLGLGHIEQEALYNQIADAIVEELNQRGIRLS
jgi:hypothetical protein